MKRLFVVLLFLISTPLVASHIVGGEFELLHVNGFNYQLNLIYYFDVVANPTRDIQREEPRIWVYIYRKSDNMKMDSIQLDWLRKTRVGYTQPNCSAGEIVTDKIIYTKTIELNASKYSHPDGYYVMWARCCRNYSILNILSKDPQQPGNTAAGQTFYLEFPPVMINGKQFINSSPKNFPALNDYACPTKPYYVDFAGEDVDGDSLVYTMVTPFSTKSVVPSPGPSPQPYPDVSWLTPYFGLDKIVNGTPKDAAYPDLAISRAGFLRVTPRSQGLYVFAVKVEEFRNKKKIGEMRRDFQMLVTDCRLSVAPQISGKKLNDATFTRGTINVQFSNSVSDQDRCIVVSVKDDDSNRAADNFQETISLKIVALNFKGELSSLLPATSSKILRNNETAEFNICFDKCPFFLGGAAQIGIIAFDDACALPMMDTLRVNVEVEPPDNQPARFSPPEEINATLMEGDEASWNFEAHDADNDDLVLFTLPSGFSMGDAGMTLEVTEDDPGILKGTLHWNARCDIYDFTKRTNFPLKLFIDDQDECDLNEPDVLEFKLNVTLPPDNEPVVDTDLTADVAEIEVDIGERHIYDRLSFNVTGEDLVDNDLVTVKMVGDGFNPSDYGMSFQKKSGVGTVHSLFNWDLSCDRFDLSERDSFNIAFLAIDSTGKCRVRYLDSMVVKVKVIPPINRTPQITLLNLNNDIQFDGQTAVVWPGQQFDLQLNVTDNDVAPVDLLSVQVIDAGGDEVPENWSLTNSSGPSVLSSIFSWAPLCSIFRDNVFEHDFYFDFKYGDDRCLTAEFDTIRVNVKVKDRESGNILFEPVNVFTPNGDGINDFYSMERRNENGELVSILPFDNCQGVFENVRIYNRWGRTVFTSTDRNFRWYGLEEAAGVYFYHVTFSNRDFKGTVSLRN